MAWPTPTDYAEAVQKPSVFLEDEELRGGQVARTPLGLPMLWSGNFADVYKMHCPATGNTWALKCFTRPVQGLHERYRIIAAHLERARLPFTVDFQYLEHGIRIRDEWFPAIKMRWVEGLTLNQFVEEHLERPRNLQMLLDLWVKLAARLREAGIAHADLQHGNVILVPQNGGALALRLVDYDGMYVPALAGTRSGEVGLPAYQHPQRIREGLYNAEVDRFSHLVIYTAIRCLMVGRNELWQRFNTGENLLFRSADFRQPEASELFRSLWRTEDPDAKALIGHLILACRQPLEESALLQEIVATDGRVLPLSRDEQLAVEAIMGAGAIPAPATTPPAAPNAAPAPAWLVEATGQPTPSAAMAAATPPALPSSPPAASNITALPSWISRRLSEQPATPILSVAPPPYATPLPLPPRFIPLQLRSAPALWRIVSAVLRPFQWVDSLLARLVGKRHSLLHGFLRVAVGFCIIGIVATVLSVLAPHWVPWLPGSDTIPANQLVLSRATTLMGEGIKSPIESGHEDGAIESAPPALPPTVPPVMSQSATAGVVGTGHERLLPVKADSGNQPQKSLSSQENATKLSSPGLYAKRTMGNRQQWIAKYGGLPESETAVEEGLEWLARHQHAMGFWANRCLGSNAQSRCEKPTFCTAAGSTCEMAHSGLALLAFQAAGHYYFNQQKHSDTVRSGLDWLVANQSSDGALVGSLARPSNGSSYLHQYCFYEHGIAAFALADACASAKAAGVTPDPRYLDALARSVTFIEKEQHDDGGWRYPYGAGQKKTKDGRSNEFQSQPSDTSVTGWQVLALKSAREAGLDFSAESLEKIRSFFTSRMTGSQGRTAYLHNYDVNSDATTGVGMLARQFLLNEPDAQLVHDAADYLAQEASRRWTNLPAPGNNRDYYLWYNCTLAMFQAGGENWKRWNEVVRDTIIKLQEHSGCARGSWGADCRWGDRGGRIYSTALAVLTLEVYYRYTPYSEQQAFATEPTKAGMPPRTDSVSLEPSKASQGLPLPATENVVTAPNPGKEKDFQRQIAARFKMPAELSNSIGMKLVLIPAGEFMMGSEDGDSDEKPTHRERIAKPFYLGVHEVTQSQYEQVMGTNPSKFTGDPQRSVEQVSWEQSVEFCRRLSQKEDQKYRLPTEAEWEYACRAGSSTKWCFGDDESALGGYAWYGNNSDRTTHPVGQKQSNAWGLCDMHGNVREWCQDWKSEYGADVVSAPSDPSSGSYRVSRGGSWFHPARGCRSADRDYSEPGYLGSGLGLRVLLVAEPVAAEPAIEKPKSESTVPLKLQPIPPQTIEIGEQLAVAVSVEDAKRWEGKVRFSLGPQSPRGAKIDPETGNFTWAPTEDLGSGQYEIAVSAEGPGSQKQQTTFTVTVTKPTPAAIREIAVDLGLDVKLELVLIPAGSFAMGDESEAPVHKVNITKPFYLGKYEVTQAQWRAVTGNNPSDFQGPKNPVEQVSWGDCQVFLRKLNAKAGKRMGKFVLPTEAQWEYACRAGSSTKWCFGDDESALGDYAWYDRNSGSTTHPVGQKKPNAWGLYDMHGNVWEWCADWWKAEYGSDAVSDPSGPSSGSDRVLRGGSWFIVAGRCRSASRFRITPGIRYPDLGFRALLVPAE